MDCLRFLPAAERTRARLALDSVAPQLAALPARDADLFSQRLARRWLDLVGALERLYPLDAALLAHITSLLADAAAQRPATLRLLDSERELQPDWFQQATMVGSQLYVDLFNKTLRGVLDQLPYLQELGVNYVHLMPLLSPRSGPNDGGYAVRDYRAVDPRLGSLEDLRAVAAAFHAAGMTLCLDVVVNHTAREHAWAQAAQAGDPGYQDYYLTFADRTLPDQYEQTLPEVFPDFAPGNFTWYPDFGPDGRWVWTTFNEFQWDLNYTNPMVWCEMLSVLLFLGNQGVDVLRLDAVPFMWKRLGTASQNQPEVLDVLQAWRAALHIACPATIVKAEAIVPPDELVQYLGQGQRSGKLCELAYHNALMVLLWSSLATRKVQLLTHSLQQMPALPAGSAWVTYVRCHDDIGWAISDANAEAVGESGFGHRSFLSDWYAGQFPDTWARGVVFQFNPLTGDRRISGTTASLAGLEAALSANSVELAIRRIALLHSMIFAFGGIPLISMGDELGLLNDPSYLHDPAKAADNRWLHRPPMRWGIAAQRHDPLTVPGRIWAALQALVAARRRTPSLHAAGATTALWTGNEHVAGILRDHPYGRVLVLANFSESPQPVATALLWEAGLRGSVHDQLAPSTPVDLHRERLLLAPYQSMWLLEAPH